MVNPECLLVFMWQGQVTCDMWHVTHEMWQATHDMLQHEYQKLILILATKQKKIIYWREKSERDLGWIREFLVVDKWQVTHDGWQVTHDMLKP